MRVTPRIVVHTAAETNVDRCETERGFAKRVNVDGSANVADACAKVGARLAFVSTDYSEGDLGEADKSNCGIETQILAPDPN